MRDTHASWRSTGDFVLGADDHELAWQALIQSKTLEIQGGSGIPPLTGDSLNKQLRAIMTALGIAASRRYGAAQSHTVQTAQSAHTGRAMAEKVVPHFHNQAGVPVIEVGAHEFMCIGAPPPFDHPHIFLDMGNDSEIVCSYCSTLYRYNASLDSHESRPEECAWHETAAS